MPDKFDDRDLDCTNCDRMKACVSLSYVAVLNESEIASIVGKVKGVAAQIAEQRFQTGGWGSSPPLLPNCSEYNNLAIYPLWVIYTVSVIFCYFADDGHTNGHSLHLLFWFFCSLSLAKCVSSNHKG